MGTIYLTSNDRDEELDHSPTLGALFAALAAAQGMMKPAKKDSKNPHFGNTYASLDSVWDAIREPLSKNGLAVIQGTRDLPGGGTLITTTLGHSSGEWMRSSLTLILTAVGKPTDPITMQALGSALSYGRRYGMSMVGVVTDTDDDGEAASRSVRKEPTPKPTSMDEVPHVCGIHKVDFKRYSKPDSEVWYSHKLSDGKWCNEGKAEAGKKPEEPTTDRHQPSPQARPALAAIPAGETPALAPKSAPAASQDAPKGLIPKIVTTPAQVVVEQDFLAMSDIEQANLLIEAVGEFGRDKWAKLRQEIGLPVKPTMSLTAEQRLTALKAIVGAEAV